MFINTHPIRPHDFWWHITVGREILTTGHIPTVDIYSYTANGLPYPSYNMFWLMEIILFWVYKQGGSALVILMQSLMVTTAYGVIFWICKQVTKSWRVAAFGVLFAAALGFNDWNVRPQGITFLLASLFILAILQYRNTKNWGWLTIFPVGMILWVNSHGTFFIGLILIGIWFGDELWHLIKSRWKQQPGFPIKQVLVPGIALGITALSCLANPRGLGIITYLRTLTGNSAVQNLVTEWAPPTFHTLMGEIFFVGLAGSIILLVISPKRPGFVQLCTFILFGILSLRTSRGIVWYGIVMAPILAEAVSEIIKKYKWSEGTKKNSAGNPILNYTVFFLVALMGVISLPWFKGALPFSQAKAGLISAETPIQAIEELLQVKPPGRVYNSISFGSYLIWSAYPEYQVFVDSRIELFPEKVWLDYLNISNATQNWELLLDAYGVNTLMLNPYEQAALIEAVNLSGLWVELYQDSSAILYTRK